MVLQVETPTDGVMRFNGKDTRQFSNADRREYRASVQAVFQDPWEFAEPEDARRLHHHGTPVNQPTHGQA